jgi:phenylalanyl-tRNA synthetase beta chain
LTGLGLVLRSGDGDASVWGVPSFRADLVREIDLIEEVARVIGIEAIPGRVGGAPAAPGDADAAYDFAMETRRRLVGLGLHEARTGTLVSDGDPGAVVLRNPLGTDQSRLRGSLVPGLLDALARNVRLGAARIALFEIGRVFSVSGETTQAAFVLTGPSRDPNWLDPSPVSYGWAHARGVIEAVLRRTVELRRQSSDGCFAVTAEMVIDGTRVGRLGLLSPAEQRSLGAGGAVVVGEWDLAAVRPTAVGSGFSEPAKFPVVTRDLAVVVAQKTPFEDVTAAVRGAGESLLRTVTLFDVFVDPDGVKLPVDRKSLAISLTFQAPDRTLSADEVHASIGRIREKLQSELAAEFRE